MPEQYPDRRSSVTGQEACRRFDAVLAAYLEGEEQPEIGAHARQCPFCYSILADLEQIRSASRDLGWEEPPATLWASVRAVLISEGVIRPRRRFWERLFSGLRGEMIPAAALACLALAAAVLIEVPGRHASRKAPIAFGPTAAMPQDAQVADVLADMENAYRARAASFDPPVRAAYAQGLESLDDEIRECQRSVQEDPANALAREYLVNAYTQKARLLEAALEYEGR
jgi:hypothetical protein